MAKWKDLSKKEPKGHGEYVVGWMPEFDMPWMFQVFRDEFKQLIWSTLVTEKEIPQREISHWYELPKAPYEERIFYREPPGYFEGIKL